MLRLTLLKFNSNLCKCKHIFLGGNARWKSNKVLTYYEVLNVPNDCSSRDIRNAFVKLSKQYHPDATGNKETNAEQFVQISEAYKTLVKETTRREYDDSLLWSPSGSARSPLDVGQTWEVKPNYHPNPGPYYGIKGIERVSNIKVALFLLVLGIAGAVFGFSSVKHSFHLHRQVQDEVSAEANTHHATVVADAQKYGNKEQIKRMAERLARDPYK
ncbi:dnaJ-like protein 60 isoform X2 [Drosophila busckii]|uniref:dnaJ-like protein 60 isoform X2 n=1 Tax=Drosophila busckii TaxID=30019 RepID=UPI00083EFF82|nr:dnaJ-like protein 60 isoform X2 [Drosophila busckii]